MLPGTCPAPTGELRAGRNRFSIVQCGRKVSTTCSPRVLQSTSSFRSAALDFHKAAGKHVDMESLPVFLIEMIDIRIRAFRWHNLVLDTVESCCEHAGKGEIRVAHRVRATELSTGAVTPSCGNANKRRTIGCAPGNITGGFVTWDKTLV